MLANRLLSQVYPEKSAGLFGAGGLGTAGLLEGAAAEVPGFLKVDHGLSQASMLSPVGLVASPMSAPWNYAKGKGLTQMANKIIQERAAKQQMKNLAIAGTAAGIGAGGLAGYTAGRG